MKYREILYTRIVITIALLIVIAFDGAAQDSTKSITENHYLIPLNIPEDWEIKRQLEGGDFTLSAYSPDNKAFIYYCQFMNDNKIRPKTYFKTYTRQFGMNGKPKMIAKEINNNRIKLLFSIGEGMLLDEKYKIIFFASNVNRRNIITYLVYPLDDATANEEAYKSIMLYK